MTGKRVWVGAAALCAVVTLGVAGCGDGESDETPTTPEAAQPWDPCSLSDEALQAATLDPATEGPGFAAEPPGWKTCGWKTIDQIGIKMSATATVPVEQFRNDPRNFDFRDVTVGDRPAFTYVTEIGKPDDFCHLVVPFESGGVLNMQVSHSVFTKDPTPMCEWAVQVGTAVADELPR
ncbi:DUF3558 domain-containing protein [Rhodococcus sp. NPDC058521]|uniref:DUF3558 domain-containing protein n=1 Tax=Rhodococcus sp. NPDC058521 TaxID=3346536 RepID=UPI0036553359